MVVPNFVFTFQFFNLPRDYMYRGFKKITVIKRQFVRRRNKSVDITRAPYRQSGNVVRDSSTETRL